MKPDKNISGNTTVHNKTCNDSTFSRKEAKGKGSRPCTTNQMAVTEMIRRHRLSPPEPNRAAAHMSKARGRNKRSGVVEGNTGVKPKTKKVATAVPRTKNPASQKWPHVAPLIQRLPLDVQSTITGTIVSSANAFVQKRSALIDRYPRPQPVRTTPAASRKEGAKGATRTPNSTKREAPRTLSNTLVGRTSCPMQNAPIKASLVLVASQAV